MSDPLDVNDSDFFPGKIISFVQERGFGFIRAPGFQKDIFFHYKFLQGEDASDIYKLLFSEEPTNLSIDVIFRIRESEKGIQAIEITGDPYYLRTRLIEKTLRESCFRSDQPLDAFLASIPPDAYWLINREAILRKEVVSKIIDSEFLWTRLVEFSISLKDVSNFLSVRGNSWGGRELKIVEAFMPHICTVFGATISGKPDYHPEFSMVEQKIINVQSPLRFFREQREFSVVVLPNFKALNDLERAKPDLITSNARSIKLILVISPEKGALETTNQHSGKSVIVLDLKALPQSILGKHDRFRSIVGKAIREVLPVESLQPFVISSDYHSDIFVGRNDIRQDILESVGSHYLVYGGRKIGKTWLIHDICHQCDIEPYNSRYAAVYASLQSCESTDDAVDEIEEQARDAGHLPISYDSKWQQGKSVDALKRIGLILNKIKLHTGKTVLLAIDEVDDLLKKDVSLFKRLRQITSNKTGSFKLVFSGYKELLFATYDEDSNHPFANWGTRIPLECLEKSDMETMVLKSLQWLGLDLRPDSSAVIDKIYELTAGHPFYTQYLCLNATNKALRKKSKNISPTDIEESATESFFTEIFTIFSYNLSPLQKLIGKIFAADVEDFSDVDIQGEISRRFKISIDRERIQMEMKILQACSVFCQTTGFRYHPLMRRINKEYFANHDDEELAFKYLENKNEH